MAKPSPELLELEATLQTLERNLILTAVRRGLLSTEDAHRYMHSRDVATKRRAQLDAS